MVESIVGRVRAAAAYLEQRTPLRPAVGLVLGSGLDSLATEIEDAISIPTAEIPHLPVPTVAGHPGRWLLGHLGKAPVAVLHGRPHFYEGHDMASAALHVWVLRQLGCHTLILTNAAGALNPYFWPGDIMLVTDHINLPGLVGHNPLVGQPGAELGTRFVDMNQAYDVALGELASEVARECRFELRRGVYVMVGGPSYETQAELRFLRAVGGDAVGMSTAHEVVAARQCGLRVLGLSGISNLAIGTGAAHSELTHDEVLAAGELLRPKFDRLLKGLMQRLDAWPSPAAVNTQP